MRKSKVQIKRLTFNKYWAGHLIKPSSLPPRKPNPNCRITANDVHRAVAIYVAIYGPGVPILAGKMVRIRKQYNTTTNKERVVVHPQILHHKNLHLHTEFLHYKWKTIHHYNN